MPKTHFTEEEDDNNHDNNHNTNNNNRKLFTPVIISILATETAERFAYFGFRAVLVLYFTHELGLDETTAISSFAYTTCLANFSPLAGALLAESSLGRFRTILCFGCCYAVGLMILTQAAFLPTGDSFATNHTTITDVTAGDGDDGAIQVEKESTDFFLKRALTFLGLLLICTGTGGIKPCVNIFGADQIALRDNTTSTNNNNTHTTRSDLNEGEEEEIISRTATTQTDLERSSEEEHAVRQFFNFFYFCINLGALSSFTFIPIVKAHYGFGAAFLLPTICMCTALVVFYSRRKEYIYRQTEGKSTMATTFQILFCELLFCRNNSAHHQAIAQQEDDGNEGPTMQQEMIDCSSTTPERFQDEPTSSSFEPTPQSTSSISPENQSAPSTHYQESLADAQQALKILPIMAMLPIFWMLYDQQGSVWTLQATRMNLHGLQPEQINLLNPLEIMVLIPLFDRVLYPVMEAWRLNIAPLRRMGWGMMLAAISFVVSGLLEHLIENSPDGSVSVLFQVPQITILAVGEIFLSVTGLEYAYSRSPDRLKGFIMATYLLTTAVGDLLGGVLYSSVFRTMDRAVAMYVCASCMLLNRCVFGRVVVATQQEDDAAAAAAVNKSDTLSGSADFKREPYSDRLVDESKVMSSNGLVELVEQATIT